MKNCSKCNLNKDTDLFSNDKRYSDGKYPSCKSCKAKITKSYYLANRDEIIRKDVKRHILKLKDDAYRVEHNRKCREWNRNNPRKEYHARYNRDRRKTDLNFKIAGNLRNRLYCCIRDSAKSGSAINDLGCSIDELKKHLENKWQDGMSWDNYGNGPGKWNIDHITPLSTVNLCDSEEFKKVCHYDNLQPLWYLKNIIKSNRAQYQDV